MSDSAQYGREWASDYDVDEDVEHALMTAQLIDSLAQGKPVLEVAAGTGRVACRLKSPNITATDASEEMLEVLRSKSSAIETRVEVLPKISGGPYGVVAILANSLWVLIKASDQYKFFHYAAKALKPGGYLVVETSKVDLSSWGEPKATPKGIRTVIYSTQFQRAQLKFSQDDKVRYVVIRWTTEDELSGWADRAGFNFVRSIPTSVGTDIFVLQRSDD